MSDPCELHFPVPAELARLQDCAQSGRREAFVGAGDPDTVLQCEHGEWRLGDVTAPPARACTEVTKAGEPCKGTPGDDGLCAAHKAKGDDGATAGTVAAAGDADPQAEEAADAAAESGQVSGG